MAHAPCDELATCPGCVYPMHAGMSSSTPGRR
uniref:Uncharacterized protein n=1 Tax=Anguilla anguilla TaxID=7936 RepID=A0A0E9UGK8_ANGAN